MDVERREGGEGRETVEQRVADLAARADERVADLTGRPVGAWLGELRTLVRDHPLPAIALMLGLGYVAGKVLRR